MLKSICHRISSKKTLDNLLNDLNTSFLPDCYDGSGTGLLKSISDKQYLRYKKLTSLMSKEELKNPQHISIERIKELSNKSGVLLSDIHSLIFYFEVTYRMNLPMRTKEDIEDYQTMVKQRGIQPLSQDIK